MCRARKSPSYFAFYLKQNVCNSKRERCINWCSSENSDVKLALDAWDQAICPGGIKKKLLYEKPPPQISTLYPFIHHFWQTRYPFRIPSTVKPLGMAYWPLITGWLFNTNLWNLWYKQTRMAELKERPPDPEGYRFDKRESYSRKWS